MSAGSLDCLFKPHRVAVVGAGSAPTNLGHMVVRNLLEGNFEGVIYPINPKRESIGGVQAYPSVLETPEVPDLAIICVPAKFVPSVVKQCGERGTKGLIILAAGFREVGAEGRALEDEVVAEARSHGMRILGPNCLGLEVPSLHLNASFASHMTDAGSIAFVSQSGALTAAAIEWAIGKGIGFSKIVTLGNIADVGVADVLDYLADDDETDCAVVYAESISNPQAFTAAASRFSAKKPIFVYKAGRFAASAKAAVSHTGAMAGADSVYEAAFRRVGAKRVLEISELYHAIELLASGRRPTGSSLAIVTNAGGPGVMSVDALSARGGHLVEISPETIEALNEVLPAAWSHANPIDVLGDASASRYEEAIKRAVQDPNADGLLVILTPQSMTDILGVADAVIAAAATTEKPVLATWMGGGETNALAIERLTAAGVPTFEYPEDAVNAFMNVVEAAAPVPSLLGSPADDGFTPDRETAAAIIADVPDTGILPERPSKRLFQAYGLTVAVDELAHTADEAVELADSFGYPIVLKIASPDITHKTDVGGVVVGLEDAEQVREAFQAILDRARAARPEARIEGVNVQHMVEKNGQELIMGANQDATFGAVIMLAAGGVTAEITKDKALELAPVDKDLARTMLESLRIWPLLEGYRGMSGADLDSLVTMVQRFSRLVVEHPEITEIEINPVLANPDGAVALDARAVIDRDRLDNPPAAYSHLGILPDAE